MRLTLQAARVREALSMRRGEEARRLARSMARETPEDALQVENNPPAILANFLRYCMQSSSRQVANHRTLNPFGRRCRK